MTYRIDEKPVFRIDSILIEEKGSADETLIEKVGRKSREPLEYVKAGTGLEHKEGDCLLKEQANYDGAPLDVRPMFRCYPKTKLKHDEPEDGDSAVAIFRTLCPANADQRADLNRTLAFRENQKLSQHLTFSSLKPNAEPRTTASRANQPRP